MARRPTLPSNARRSDTRGFAAHDMTASNSFYVIGGTLRPDAPCYVERRADAALFEGLSAGDFCYVLTSRQMGKSSLMVRTVGRLRQEGHAVAVLDLTAIGQNLSVEQWYNGLLERLGAQLDIEDELEDHWELSSQLSPVQRWFSALRDEGLKAAESKKGLVIFIDEIDSVRSLPFSTDEFFAAIRECYNRRANDARLERVTFCLLGVATPSDLIQDTRTTPFNIGRRVELRDFTRLEAEPLVDGLKGFRDDATADALLNRILYWTNGQPYLTQRFCQAVAEDESVTDAAAIDAMCDALFLSEKAREKNDNLIFVRERILRSQGDLAALLDLYGKVWKGRKEPDDPSNPLVCVLRLSGITQAVEGGLAVRNRIYQRVFDDKWARANMPDAELRRQREAYVSGIWRTALVAFVVVLAISFFAGLAIRQRMRAEENYFEVDYQKKKADFARAEAERAASELSETLARMEMQQAETAMRSGHSADGIAHLAHVLRGNPTNRTAAVWLMSALSQRSFARPIFRRDTELAEVRESPFYSPDGGRVIASMGNEAHVLSETGEIVAGPMLYGGSIPNDAREFSPDGGRVALGSADNTARVWDAFTGRALTPPLEHAGQVSVVHFSPDGLRLLTVTLNRVARVWDAFTGRSLCEPIRLPRGFGGVRFSKDGTRIVMEPPEPRPEAGRPGGSGVERGGRTGGRGGGGRPFISWDVRPGGMLGIMMRHRGAIGSVEFAPEGGRVLIASHDGSAAIWDAGTGERVTDLMEHELRINQAGFSPDGRLVTTASEDRTARIWNAGDGSPLTSHLEHEGPVHMAVFSPDNRLLATASEDGTARVWRVGTGEIAFVCDVGSPTLSVMFSPDGARLMTASTDRRVRLWDTATGAESPGGFQVEYGSRRMGPFRRSRGRGQSEPAEWIMARFSDDGAKALTLVNGRFSSEARIWDFESGDWMSGSLDHNSFVRSARFAPGSARVVTASDDRTARVWTTAAGDPVGTAMEHGSEVLLAGFFPDGRKVFTFSARHETRVWDAGTGIPLSEPYAHAHQHFHWGSFDEPQHTGAVSPDGRWLAAPSGDLRLQIWEALTTGEGSPTWLPELAESIVGRRVDARGLFENVVPGMGRGGRPGERSRPGDEIRPEDDSSYAVWGRWFLSDRGERTISPSASMTVSEYIERLIEADLEESLREALHMMPDRPAVLSRLADVVEEGAAPDDERARREALFYGHRAAEVAGEDSLRWLAHAGRAGRQGDEEEMDSAIKTALSVAVKQKDEELLKEVRARAERLREAP